MPNSDRCSIITHDNGVTGYHGPQAFTGLNDVCSRGLLDASLFVLHRLIGCCWAIEQFMGVYGLRGICGSGRT